MPTIPYKNAKGEKLSGVTTIISGNLGWNKQPLMYWANQMGQQGKSHRDVAQEAANAGTIAHYLIECDIKGRKPDTSQYQKALVDQAETAFINYLEWRESVYLEPIEVEPHLISERYQFGATPDVIARIKGKISLPDWKTGNGTYEDHLIQLAAYKVAWEENHPDMPIEGGFHLIRTGKAIPMFDYKWRGELPGAWEAFEHALGLHNLHKQLKKLV